MNSEALTGHTISNLEQLVDEMTYINYAHNRRLAPEVAPAKWERVYGQSTEAMEARFQIELEKNSSATTRSGDARIGGAV